MTPEEEYVREQHAANTHSRTLQPMDEAKMFHDLVHKHNLTVKVISERSGYSQKIIRQRLKLMTLPKTVQWQVADGTLSPRQALDLLKNPTGERP